jgi:alpha-1,2-mannosyltransferase
MWVHRIRHTPTWVLATAATLMWLVSGAVMVRFGAHWHLDLRVYRDAGHALFTGGSPYSSYFTEGHLPFTYTPFALLVLSPLSLGPLGLVEAAWWSVSGACLIAVAYMMLTTAFPMPRRRAMAVAGLLGGLATIGLEPVRSNMDYGQINLVLMAMVVFDVTRVRAPRRGVLVGLAAAVKLTPLVYLVWFLIGRDLRSTLRGIGVFVGASAVGWLILPSESVRYWLHEVSDASRTGQLGNVSNQSWNGLVHRPPFGGGHLGTIIWFTLSVLTVAGAVSLSRRLMQDRRMVEVVMVLALTELLVSPVSWTHHWSWLVVSPIVVATLWSVHRVVASMLLGLFCLAVVAPYWWILHGPASYLTGNTLVLGGAAVLGAWVMAEARLRRGAT